MVLIMYRSIAVCMAHHSTKIYDVTAWCAIQTATVDMHADGMVQTVN